MADPLYELLAPYLDATESSPRPLPPAVNPTTAKYLNRLSTLSVSSLNSTEIQSLSQSSHSNLVSLQALANRSHKSFITSADNLRSLQYSIPKLAQDTQRLRNAIPKLDEETVNFSSTYSRGGENQILDRRKKLMQLVRNVDRLSDILELPELLSTAVSSSSSSMNAVGTAGISSSTTTYSSALDLFAHIKRLQTLYPDSPIIREIYLQAEDAMRDMTSSLVSDLRVQNLRLAPAIRIVGWLRRIAPELEKPGGTCLGSQGSASEGAFGALFLVCRLANLLKMLEALAPLRDLADQETNQTSRSQQNGARNNKSNTTNNTWSGGQQTERFLKRYIEIYREQSFAIVSMYKNIFAPSPSESDLASSLRGVDLRQQEPGAKDRNPPKSEPILSHLPPALATFPLHLTQLLTGTLKEYLPNIKDKGSRESLLTQVLYCAGSLGRLGGDFGLVLSLLEDGIEGEEKGDKDVSEWEEVMKKHRALAERLDLLTSGAGELNGKGSQRSDSPAR